MPETKDLLTTLMRLPASERAMIAAALNASLCEEFEALPEKKLESSWSEEVLKRVEEIDRQQVETVPADKAEMLIRGDE